MTRATGNILAELHGEVAGTLLNALKEAREAGEVPSPQLLGQVIKFLKDNGIDQPSVPGNEVDDLTKELEKINIDDNDNIVSIS